MYRKLKKTKTKTQTKQEQQDQHLKHAELNEDCSSMCSNSSSWFVRSRNRILSPHETI